MSKHDQHEDPAQWVNQLSQAMVEGDAQRPTGEASAPGPSSGSARLPWFHVMTICGLAVLLIPAGQSRLGKGQGDPEATAAVAPSVLGWRQERSAEGLSFGEDTALTYRGLQAPARSEINIAVELAKIGRTALVPLRIALGQHFATMSGVQRIVLHNLPASAYVSAGRRTADGTWVIDDGDSRDVMIGDGAA